MNSVYAICIREENTDPLDPKHYCKNWDGKGEARIAECPDDRKPEDCEFAVKPIPRK